MGRCSWHGDVCNCGQGWPFPINGKMPARCEERVPVWLMTYYMDRVSDAAKERFKATLAEMDAEK